MSIAPGLITHWLSCFKTFTSIIFYYLGQMPPDAKWRNRAKRNDKEHHEKTIFFFSCNWVLEWFLFCEKTSSSLPMLFVHVGKSSSETLRSSRSQMFLKIVVLKTSQYSKKNQLFLIRLHALRPVFLLKQRFRHMCFLVNIAKFLRTAFLWNTFCSLYFS